MLYLCCTECPKYPDCADYLRPYSPTCCRKCPRYYECDVEKAEWERICGRS